MDNKEEIYSTLKTCYDGALAAIFFGSAGVCFSDDSIKGAVIGSGVIVACASYLAINKFFGSDMIMSDGKKVPYRPYSLLASSIIASTLFVSGVFLCSDNNDADPSLNNIKIEHSVEPK